MGFIILLHIIFTFIISIFKFYCVYLLIFYVPRHHANGGQRTTCGNCFFPLHCESQALNLGHQVRQQALYPLNHLPRHHAYSNFIGLWDEYLFPKVSSVMVI